MQSKDLIVSMMMAAFLGTGSAAFAVGKYRADFNRGWKFSQDSVNWRVLDLPHDWAIEGDFSADNPSGAGGGALPGGIGYYTKTFSAGNNNGDKRLFIDFDGSFMNTSVWINGHLLGTRPYGYSSFSYDLTPYIKSGENTISVKVDNSLQPNSRWYSGCGIYRNVWLRERGAVHVPLWGQHVVPYDISKEGAKVKVATNVVNTGKKAELINVVTQLFAPDGRSVASVTVPMMLKAGEEKVCDQILAVSNPALWSVDAPNLYTVRTVVDRKGKVLDRCETTTGFRTLRYDAAKGFFLNDSAMKINGVCLHHDAGALGAVVNRRAIQRQLEIMKEMGVNAIRTTHNPPAPELLELCDSMGLMVQDEFFDMWRKRKTEYDYSRYFNEWHERDLTDQMKRDRNHPSVIQWSIGNEVLEQWSDANADTLSLAEANLILNFGHSKDMLADQDSGMSVNSLLTKKLVDMTHALDSTRLVTAGCNEPDPGNHLFRSGALDIIGYNYHNDNFRDVPRNFPGKPFVITESVSGLMTRGAYIMPSDSMYIWPERWDKPFHREVMECSSYDNNHVPWGSTHERTMRDVQENDFIMGQFVWTGFDYIGEPTPYGFPARSSFFGIVDLAGIPKDIYYMYQSQWRPDKTVLHLFPHWNWKEGQDVDMWAYYNNADEVELFLNGKSRGIKTMPADKYHVMWRLKFEPGELTAVSRKDGKEVARQTIRTAGAPAQIRLTPDRNIIKKDGYDLSYVLVEVLDKDGNLCPWADNEITFNVSGAGKNVGVDNGSPISMERFKADHRKAFYGKAMLIVQSDGTAGNINVKATSPKLKAAETTITAH